jgi:hypothetical protein
LKNKKDLYLIAFYVLKPIDPKMTKVKGYMSDPANVYFDETVNITRGLKPSDHINSKIVLNLSKKEVVKNTLDSKTSWDELLLYFEDGYGKYINTVLNKDST